MPVMDGMAFIQAFKETKHALTTAVVALTANCDEVRPGKADCCQAYMFKLTVLLCRPHESDV
jgi:CheY-like chemotaxis protein